MSVIVAQRLKAEWAQRLLNVEKKMFSLFQRGCLLLSVDFNAISMLSVFLLKKRK